jgi:protein gp37
MSKIQWTDETWNPMTGCSKVSPGCANCYAERMARRLCAMGQRNYAMGFDEQIAAVFGVMAACPQHTFQVLTKRPERMVEWFRWLRKDGPASWWNAIRQRLPDSRLMKPTGRPTTEILPNVWLGVSAENQAAADERIPLLLQAPAAVRFVSCEPLLGAVDLRCVQHDREFEVDALTGNHGVTRPLKGRGPALDWVIAGCESGPGARPAETDWFRSLRDQCQEAGVPFFLKQMMQTSYGGSRVEGQAREDARARRQGLGRGAGMTQLEKDLALIGRWCAGNGGELRLAYPCDSAVTKGGWTAHLTGCEDEGGKQVCPTLEDAVRTKVEHVLAIVFKRAGDARKVIADADAIIGDWTEGEG